MQSVTTEVIAQRVRTPRRPVGCPNAAHRLRILVFSAPRNNARVPMQARLAPAPSRLKLVTKTECHRIDKIRCCAQMRHAVSDKSARRLQYIQRRSGVFTCTVPSVCSILLQHLLEGGTCRTRLRSSCCKLTDMFQIASCTHAKDDLLFLAIGKFERYLDGTAWIETCTKAIGQPCACHGVGIFQ